jgi:hypothetical protein
VVLVTTTAAPGPPGATVVRVDSAAARERAGLGHAPDAALRAGDWGEFLKAASHLAVGGGAHAAGLPPPPSYAPGEPDALLLLYFACVPPRPEAMDAGTRVRAVARAAAARGETRLPPPSRTR